jgi:SM-20-related protein
MKENQFINYEAVCNAILQVEPFPYLVIPQFIKSNYLGDLVKNFPEINHRGSIPALSLATEPLFQQFINELTGEELRQTISQKFSLNLQEKPVMLTLRGQTEERDGKIHTDSKSKLITLLLYMNENWQSNEGQLRLLKNKQSLDDYVAEISPLAGSCVIFRVTPNCWHGHTLFVGKRLSMQLNYLSGEVALSKHLNHHRLTAWFKRLFSR